MLEIWAMHGRNLVSQDSKQAASFQQGAALMDLTWLTYSSFNNMCAMQIHLHANTCNAYDQSLYSIFVKQVRYGCTAANTE